MAEPTLGVAIIAHNAAGRLAQCLEALAFADDIVVGAAAVDDTVAIARALSLIHI